MLAKYLILLFIILPAVTYAGIVIKIKTTKDGNGTSVDFLGEDLAIVNDKERKLFKIDDETLHKATEKFMGKRCTNMYLKPPTPLGDVYKQYGWDPVRRNIKPIEAKVIGIDTKPVAANIAEYVNNHKSLDATYSSSVTQQIEETVGHTWSTGGETGIEQQIKYEVNYGIGNVGGSTTFSYTGSWGEDTTKSRIVNLGTTSTVTVDKVPPGDSVDASLIASQGSVDIEIRYAIELTGQVFCNYEVPYRGHHFYALPIEKLQKAADTPLLKYSSEKVSVGFYTRTKLELNNNTVL